MKRGALAYPNKIQWITRDHLKICILKKHENSRSRQITRNLWPDTMTPKGINNYRRLKKHHANGPHKWSLGHNGSSAYFCQTFEELTAMFWKIS